MAKWVLDAGHGGSDQGSLGDYRKEAEINMEAVYEAKRLLERNGEIVLLTRSSDIYLDTKERINIANKWEADYFVSLHMNSYVDRETTGTEIYIYEKGGKAEELANLIKSEITANLKSIDRGVKEASYMLLRETNMPAIIVQAEFLTNKIVEEEFDSVKYGRMVAKACLSIVDKVLIDIPQSKAKIPTREGWRICIGYYKKYEEAEKAIRDLKNIGLEGVYVVPYPSEDEVK